MRVCSKHFVESDFLPKSKYYIFNFKLTGSLLCSVDYSAIRKRLKINAVPSQNLPIRSHERNINIKLRNDREKRAVNREEKRTNGK